MLNRDLWARGFREKIEIKDDEIELEENALFSLIGSFRKAMKSMYKRVHKVNVKLQSIANRIMEMKHKLIVGKQVSMSELFNDSITDVKEKSRNILITFLSLLELGKMELVSIYQTETYGEIYINTKKEIDDDVVSKAENYDNINADSIALNLIQRNSNVLTEAEVEEIEAETQFELTENLDDLSLIDKAEVLLTEDMATDEEIWAAETEESSFERAIETEPNGETEAEA